MNNKTTDKAAAVKAPETPYHTSRVMLRTIVRQGKPRSGWQMCTGLIRILTMRMGYGLHITVSFTPFGTGEGGYASWHDADLTDEQVAGMTTAEILSIVSPHLSGGYAMQETLGLNFVTHYDSVEWLVSEPYTLPWEK